MTAPIVFLCIFCRHCKLSFWGLRSMENHQNWKRDKLSKSNIVQVYHLDFLSILRLLQFHPLLLHARIKGLFFILNRSINVNFLNCRWVCTIYTLGPSFQKIYHILWLHNYFEGFSDEALDLATILIRGIEIFLAWRANYVGVKKPKGPSIYYLTVEAHCVQRGKC